MFTILISTSSLATIQTYAKHIGSHPIISSHILICIPYIPYCVKDFANCNIYKSLYITGKSVLKNIM